MTCPACTYRHDNICYPLKDALWSLVKSKDVPAKVKTWARIRLGLDDR